MLGEEQKTQAERLACITLGEGEGVNGDPDSVGSRGPTGANPQISADFSGMALIYPS